MDEPIDAQFRQAMHDVCHHLDAFFNGKAQGFDRQVGFALFVFPFGQKDTRVNYISNSSDRKEMATMLRTVADRFDAQEKSNAKS